jgi:hypothetical protein
MQRIVLGLVSLACSLAGCARAIEFKRVEVELRDVMVAGNEIEVDAPLDLTEPSEGLGQLIGTARVPADERPELEFTIGRLTLEGSASKGEVTKAFAWEFDTPIHYFDCETTARVPADGTGELQITLHADHLFL